MVKGIPPPNFITAVEIGYYCCRDSNTLPQEGKKQNAKQKKEKKKQKINEVGLVLFIKWNAIPCSLGRSPGRWGAPLIRGGAGSPPPL